jgi:hypothetical protein
MLVDYFNAHPLGERGLSGRNGCSIQGNRTRVGTDETSENRSKRGLPGPVLPNDCVDFSGCKGGRNATKSGGGAEALRDGTCNETRGQKVASGTETCPDLILASVSWRSF